MKKTVLLLLLYAALGFAQRPFDEQRPALDFVCDPSTQLLAFKDFKASDGRMIVSELPCQINDGNCTKRFVVSVVCLENAFLEMGVEKINAIILLANQKVQLSINPALDYIPTEIKMAYNPMIKDWSLTHSFSTLDAHGNTFTNLLTMDFDSTGNFLVMKKVF